MATFTQEEIAARNARLDALAAAVKDFAQAEISRIENESKFIRTVLQGRGAESVAITNLLAGVSELEIEISNYLEVR